MLNVNSLRRSHTYRAFEVSVITCWLYMSVNSMCGHLCSFDLVLGIDITKDDDWVLPVFMIVLFHIFFASAHDFIYLFLAKIHRTLRLGSLGSRNLSRDQ